MRCNRCGEPWDLDSLHEEISAQFGEEIEELREEFGPNYWRYDSGWQKEYEKRYFNPALASFRKLGCAYFGCRCEVSLEEGSREVLDMIAELSGNDVDGAESDIELAEAMGLL